MADQLPSDANIKTTKESVEVLDANGNALASDGSKNLNDIFDKIEAGKDSESAVKEVMENKPTPPAEPKEEPKPEPEPKNEEPPKEEPKKEEPKSDIPDEELAVLPTDKPKTAKRIQALLTKIAKEAETVTQTKKEAQEKAARVKELEDKLASVKTVDPKTEEEIQKKLTELDQYRRRYQLENDPEVKSRYDNRITSADETIEKTLRSRGAGEALLKIIKEEGGFRKFADSMRVIPMANGATQTAAEIAEAIMASLPYGEKRLIDQSVNEQIQATKDKERFIAEEQNKASEYFKQQEKAQQEQLQSQQKYVDEARKAILDWQAKMLSDNPWLKPKDVPPNATPEQKAQIAEENEWAKQANSLMLKYTSSKNIHEILEALEPAVKYHHERMVNAKNIAKIAALEKQIERMKTGSRTTPKSGSLVGGGTGNVEPKNQKRQPQNLEESLALIEAGKSPDGTESEE